MDQTKVLRASSQPVTKVRRFSDGFVVSYSCNGNLKRFLWSTANCPNNRVSLFAWMTDLPLQSVSDPDSRFVHGHCILKYRYGLLYFARALGCVFLIFALAVFLKTCMETKIQLFKKFHYDYQQPLDRHFNTVPHDRKKNLTNPHFSSIDKLNVDKTFGLAQHAKKYIRCIAIAHANSTPLISLARLITVKYCKIDNFS